MRILLANSIPPKQLKYYFETSYPCLGLLYLAGAIRSKHPEVVIRYQEANYTLGELRRIISEFRPDILGFYIATDVSRTAYEMINTVKEIFPSLLVICGGPHPTAVPEEVLKESAADICCVGEGEVTILEILKHIIDGSPALEQIAGIAFRDDQGSVLRTNNRPFIERLDSIPRPLWDLAEIGHYKGRMFKQAKTSVGVLASRGCPYNCYFCSNPVWKSNKPWIRMRSPEDLASEIDYLYGKGVRELRVIADELNCSLNWAMTICQEIKKLGHKDLFFTANLRADNVTKDFAKALRDANFWLINLGIESANNRVLDGINKKITIELAIKTLQTLKDAGLKVYCNFMIYNFWEENGHLCFETPSEVDHTCHFIKDSIQRKLLDYISWGFTTPYPGSQLWDVAVKYNLMRSDRFERCPLQPTTNLPGTSEKQMLKSRRKIQFLQASLGMKSGSIEWRYVGRMLERLKYIIWT